MKASTEIYENDMASGSYDLQAEVNALKTQNPGTKDVYLAVCRLLFFSRGITPTANKLYTLVRKGSMSAPVEALQAFWTSLRSVSRVRIEHPGVPDELKGIAGDLVSTLWNAAQEKANMNLAALRTEAQAEIEASRKALADAVEATAHSQRAVLKLEDDAVKQLAVVASLQENVRVRDGALADSVARLDQASCDLRDERTTISTMRSAQETMVQTHSKAVLVVEERVHLAEDRLHEQEKRALMEIDRERQVAIRAGKEAATIRNSLERSAAQHLIETGSLHKSVSEAMQALGVLEGRLEAITAERDRSASDTFALQLKLMDAVAKCAAVSAKADILQFQADTTLKRATQVKSLTVRKTGEREDTK
jgi:predicted GNAT family acetyltransferase